MGVRIVAVAIGLVAALGTQAFRQELSFVRAQHTRLAEAETLYLPPPTMLRLLSLGYTTFAADLVHLRAYHYFVKHMISDRQYPHLDRYFETVVALDPYVHRIYHWMSQAMKFGPTITQENIHRAIAIADMGIERFPYDWQLYVDAGFNYYYELHPEDDAERERYRALGREYFATAASLPGSGLDPAFVTNIFTYGEDRQLALLHAYNLYLDASEAQREELLVRIRELEDSQIAGELARRDAEHRRDFPFIDRRFFELVGPLEPLVVPQSWADAEWTWTQGIAPGAPDDPYGEDSP